MSNPKTKEPIEFKSGVYETEYGNACEYNADSDTAFDIDMQEEIPMEMVNFEKRIRDLD
jgi:hypothetical protein